MNCVGTFGVSSAAYHWCRLMSGLGRSAFFLYGKFGWMQLIYIGDILWLVGDKSGIEKLVTIIFYYSARGSPFAWKKFSGGLVCKWVGFELTLAERALGLTERRAQWIISWVSRTVDASDVRMAAFVCVPCASQLPSALGAAVCLECGDGSLPQSSLTKAGDRALEVLECVT